MKKELASYEQLTTFRSWALWAYHEQVMNKPWISYEQGETTKSWASNDQALCKFFIGTILHFVRQIIREKLWIPDKKYFVDPCIVPRIVQNIQRQKCGAIIEICLHQSLFKFCAQKLPLQRLSLRYFLFFKRKEF